MRSSLVHKAVLLFGLAVLRSAGISLEAQKPMVEAEINVDSDRDGLSDALEQQLLEQFAPRFMVGERDCSTLPAQFEPDIQTPEIQAEVGTIYGQVFPSKEPAEASPFVEVHYYHLWRKDCGGHGHPLDTEHVAVLLRASEPHLAGAKWKAVYWYAAAHENTVCDVSQIARAATLHAEDRGATVWISPGKHASYLNESLCGRGCGADRCEKMVPLKSPTLINLGEPNHPMNGSLFISSRQWPLMAKMSATNFPSAPLERLSQLPESDIAWFNPGRHPAQGVIAKSSITQQAIAGGGRNTATALSVADTSTESKLSTAKNSTGEAISVANGSTGNALMKSYRGTRHALSTSVAHVGDALHVASKDSKEKSH